MATMLILLYAVYMGAVLLTGLGLRIGILSGPSPVAFTLIPAIVAGLIIVAALLIGYFGGELRETTKRLSHPRRRERWRAALATVPDTLAGGVRGAIAILGERPVNGSGRSAGGGSTSRCSGHACTPSAVRPPQV